MRRGVRLALDLGGVRTGVARCDATGVLASPMAVWLASSATEISPLLEAAMSEEDILEVIVGLPTNLRGNQALAAERVREVVRELASMLPSLTFRLVDERLTTVAARKQLQAAGYSTRTDKALIDAAAATILLEDALEAERRQGVAPGEIVQGVETGETGVGD